MNRDDVINGQILPLRENIKKLIDIEKSLEVSIENKRKEKEESDNKYIVSINSFKESIDLKKNEIKAIDVDIESKKTELNSLIESHKSIELVHDEKVVRFREAITLHDDSIKSRKSEISILESRKILLESEISNLQTSSLPSLLTRVSSIESEISELETRLFKIRDTFVSEEETHERKIENFLGKEKEFEGKLLSLNEEILSLHATRDKLLEPIQVEIEKFSKKKESVMKELNHYLELNEKAKNEFLYFTNQTENRKEALEKIETLYGARIVELDKEVGEKVSRKKTLNEDISALEENKEKLSSSVVVIERDITTAKGKLNSINLEIGELQKSIETKKNHHQQLSDSYVVSRSTKTKELDNIVKEITKEKDYLNSLTKKKESVEVSITTLSKQKDKLVVDVDASNVLLKESRKVLSTVGNEINRLVKVKSKYSNDVERISRKKEVLVEDVMNENHQKMFDRHQVQIGKSQALDKQILQKRNNLKTT